MILGVPGEHDPVAAHPFGEAERPRADRLALQRVHGLARVDDRALAGEVEEEVRVQALERERDRVVVPDDDVADRRVVARVRVLRLRVHRPVEDVLDVGGAQLAAVVEADAALQEEGVVPVVRGVPALGQPRHELAVTVDLHQTFLDVVEDHPRRRRGRCRREVEARRLGAVLHDQRALGARRGRPERERQGERRENPQRDGVAHRDLLLVYRVSVRKYSTVRRSPSSNPTSGV